MAVSGAQSPHVAAMSRIFDQIGKSLDQVGDKGSQVSANEADQILDEVGKLAPGTQKLVHAELIQLLVNDTFQATPEARERFAQRFGMEAKDLQPRARAELVGLSQTTNAFQLGVDALAQKPKLDRKAMKMLIGKADNYLDLNSRQFLAAVLRNASRDGTIKMDSDARKAFRKWMGGLDQASGVSDWAENFDAPGAGNVDYLSGLMSSGMCFEDILAAFMMHIAGQMQKDIMEKLKEIERSDQAARDERSTDARRKDALADAGVTLPDNDTANEVTPDVTPGEGTSTNTDFIADTKKHLESVVNAVDHYGQADSDGGAMITARESAAMAEKLDRIGPPVDSLMASALLKSLRKTPGIYLESDQLKPLVSWLQSKLGDDIDLSALPRREAGAHRSDIARGLAGSDKLEDKIAAFITDTLLVTDDQKGLKEKMADVRELSSTMREHATSDTAFKAAIADCQDGPEAKAKMAPEDPEAVVYNDGDVAPEAVQEAADAAAGAPAADELAQQVMQGAESAQTDAAEPMDARSRQMEFDKLKQMQQELSSVMQAISNVLNSLHQTAMNSIRAIR